MRLKSNILFISVVVMLLVGASYEGLRAEDRIHSIEMPSSYDGRTVCTVIERVVPQAPKQAVLYLHGYNDYFFQQALADSIVARGYAFYALELRRYGRSMLSHQKPFFVKNLNEYYADIDTTVAIMKRNGVKEIYLMGHSTGGLIISLYANDRPGEAAFKGVILNSPFLEYNLSAFQRKVLIPIVSFLAPIIGKLEIKQEDNIVYAQTLLRRYHGEWEYDEMLKFTHPRPAPIYWLSAIYKGHRRIKKGLDIQYPVWVFHSDHSLHPKIYAPEAKKADIVLDVEHIAALTPRLGKQVNEVVIKDGMHDLALSIKPARDAYYKGLGEILGNKQ